MTLYSGHLDDFVGLAIAIPFTYGNFSYVSGSVSHSGAGGSYVISSVTINVGGQIGGTQPGSVTEDIYVYSVNDAKNSLGIYVYFPATGYSEYQTEYLIGQNTATSSYLFSSENASALGYNIANGFTYAVSEYATILTTGVVPANSNIIFTPLPAEYAPVVTGASSNLAVADNSTISPFAGIVISDANYQPTEVVTVTPSAIGHGTFTSVYYGSYNSATGIYTVSGTAALVTQALDSLVFRPNSAGVSYTTPYDLGFTIQVTDTEGATTTDTNTHLVISAATVTVAQAAFQNSLGAGFVVKDTEANILTGFQSLAADTYLSAIVINENGTPVLPLTPVQQSADSAAIAKIVTPHSVAAPQTVQVDSGITLEIAGGQYFIATSGGSVLPLLVGNAPVSSGEFGAYNPTGAIAVTGGGFEIAFRDSVSADVLTWRVDGAGNYTGLDLPPTPGDDYSVESLETMFGQDLNMDGTMGVVTSTIATNGPDTVLQVANAFEVTQNGGSAVMLKAAGATISTTNFYGYAPVAVLSNTGGFEVMFKSGSTFLGLDFDSTGRFTSAATGLLAGSSYALESLETGFGVDLNGDGTIGITSHSLQSPASFSLVGVADEFEIASGGVAKAILQVSGNPISSGNFAGYTPLAALSNTAGFEVMFNSGAGFLGLQFDPAGNFTSAATGVFAGSSFALQSLETVFGVDLNGDLSLGPKTSTIAFNVQATLVNAADAFEITSGGVAKALLQVGGSQIVSGNFGGYSPIAALANAGGYEVMFKSGTTYIGLEFNSGGNFTSAATSVLSSGTYALESLDVAFNASLDGTGQVGPVSSSIAAFGPYQLNRTADAFTISSGGVLQAVLQVGGSQIVSGNFGGYSPIAALSNTGGYEVMFKSGTTYVGLEFNSGGNFTSAATSVLSSGTYALESLDVAFNASLDGTGQVGPVSSSIAAFGPYQLNRTADAFTILSGGILQAVLQVSGKQIVSGQFAGFNPVALQPIVGGYEVMFQGGSSFIGLDFNSTGNFTTAATDLLAGSSYALESLETGFGADINSDGTVGPITSTIATNGAFALVNAADAFEITSGGVQQAILQVAGRQIVSGQFAGFSLLAVLSNTGGYDVMFKSGTTFLGLDFNAGGNYTSASTGFLSANSPGLWAQEVLFNDDLNGDGQIGTPVSSIQVDSGTTLRLSGTAYTLTSAGGAPVSIAFGGTVFTSVSSVVPFGAIAVAGGYEVAWDVVGQDEYAVWKFDATGNYVSAVTTGTTVGLVTGQDFSYEQLEPVFGQDLNGDGRLARQLSLGSSTLSLTSASAATLVQLAGNTAAASGGLGSGTTLSLVGSASTLFLSSATATIEVALQPSTGVEVISGFQYSLDALNIDLRGAASSVLSAADILVSGTHAVSIYASTDPTHGIVLAGASVSAISAGTLISSHTSFTGGHAIIT